MSGSETPHPILSVVRLPARLDAEATAALLGFKEIDIPILISNGLLKPLGKPGSNSQKYFASEDLLEKSKDINWLHKAPKRSAIPGPSATAKLKRLGRRRICER